jgi:hypothetical protein
MNIKSKARRDATVSLRCKAQPSPQQALYESIKKSRVDIHGSGTRDTFVAQSVGGRELGLLNRGGLPKASPALAS